MTKFYRAIKIAFQYMFRNAGLSFASIVVMTLSFFIVSVVGITFYASTELVKHIDSKPGLVIFLKGTLSPEEQKEFEKIVIESNLVREIHIGNIQESKESFDKTYSDPELQESLKNQDYSEFLPVTVFVYSDSQENLAQLIVKLENNEYFIKNLIDTLNADRLSWYSFNQDQANFIRDANKVITAAGGVITIFLFVISSILIFITIKLTINYHKRELEIMDLVGSDGWFIRLPFIIDGMIYGILGAFFSTSIIFLFREMILSTSENFISTITKFFQEVPWPVIDAMLMLDLYFVTMVIGALVGGISSFLAILKYVKK